ncbi:hypothetical protein [Bythopirellula goksoeyrii]|uniref:Uncharacterized protein n=1 Tax=Bythopirellula goksoeyrii TaxID=1400387 RepID=A0A5B9QFF3_9BACT|nr:hypothetical protein [Bythopirellula goksoeyrii]QEG36629.1 hypothetical protein Pr1d_39440 [Bythopirellula goksoeyrii]
MTHSHLFNKAFFTFAVLSCHMMLLTALSAKSAGAPEAVGGTPQMYEDSEVRQTGWPSIPLPKITMPKVSMPDMSSITGPVKSGYQKVSTGTAKAWEGTKEMFTFGGEESPASSSRQSAQQKQGFWSKLFTAEPEPSSGPQTVGEWMSQPRLDP